MKWILFFLFIPSVFAFGVSPVEVEDEFYVIADNDEDFFLETNLDVSPRNFSLQKGGMQKISVLSSEEGSVEIIGSQTSLLIDVKGSYATFNSVVEKKGIVGFILLNIVGLLGGLVVWKKKLS